MNEAAAEKLDTFFSSLSGTPQALLLMDYDGTLAGFRIDRFKAKPWAGIERILSSIQIQGHTRMVVITGRPAGEISSLLALDPPLEVWGLHGAERLYSDGRRELESAPTGSWAKLTELQAHLKQDSLGGLYEEKANAAVMHWRGRSPAQARAIERRARALFEPLAQLDGLALLEFEAGLEIRIGRDKGGAVREIISEEAPATPVVFLGDDFTDESAFEAVNAAQGPHLSVLVRHEDRKTAADAWLKPPSELRMFLQRWLEARR